MTNERIASLPLQVRPRTGESTDSFVRRLARANHLKPSYLLKFLAGPPHWEGKPRVERLSAITGRPVANLERALADSRSPRRRTKPTPVRQRKTDRKYTYATSELFFQIRRDAQDEGLTQRELCSRYRVNFRTVRLALQTVEPPPRKVPRRLSPALEPHKPLINPLIEQGLSAKEIWVTLMDDHNVSVSYSTLNSYVRLHPPA
ncbi:TniQ family protein [Streptomyces sp. NPDC014744]|uniref:TniQ family protein n=1 Tax=Streptomyces sp. NPDC014744 TaxID=3364903 RepID=UPI0036FE4385